ncbi:MAG: poly(A) polymerase, partial [Psychrobacter sp.]|nr:poly(A) polymerase [Psychrobacter sp.]
ESGAIDSLVIYPPAEPSALVKQVAINTDKRIAAGKSINPAFFYAALLWENYLHQLEKAKKRNMPFADAQMHAAGKVIDRQRIKTAIPKFSEQFIRDIWILQPKLAAPRSKQIVQLSEHPRFRAGFDFLLLREQCGDAEHPLSESTNGMGEWWHNYQTLTEQQQDQAIDDFDENIRRGAYKQAQRGRGRNRQKQQTSNDNGKVNHIENDQQDKVNGNAHSKQVVNDASNVPSRRRRAASQSAQHANNSVSNSSSNVGRNENGRNNSYDKQQATQDNNELAQLQQLSLANIGHQAATKRHNAKPAPLFVIEHEKVVPPLRKQLPSDAQSQSSSKSPSKSKPASQAFVEKNTVTDNAAPKEQSGNQAAKHHTKPKQADVNVSTDSASAKAHTTEYATRTVARTPALVSMNNEPIPHKRRRRQPTVVENDNGNSSADSNSVVEAKAVDNKAQKATRYAKKAPKLATEAVSKTETSDVESKAKKATKATAAKPTKTSQDTKRQTSQSQSAKHQTAASKMNEQKGPVPSKRRRRQPSVNNV